MLTTLGRSRSVRSVRYADSSVKPPAQLLDRIQVDPNICFGKPCIRGTRIWVSLILDLLAGGTDEQDILREYPHLVADDIRAAIAYGAEMSRQRFVELPQTG